MALFNQMQTTMGDIEYFREVALDLWVKQDDAALAAQVQRIYQSLINLKQAIAAADELYRKAFEAYAPGCIDKIIAQALSSSSGDTSQLALSWSLPQISESIKRITNLNADVIADEIRLRELRSLWTAPDSEWVPLTAVQPGDYVIPKDRSDIYRVQRVNKSSIHGECIFAMMVHDDISKTETIKMDMVRLIQNPDEAREISEVGERLRRFYRAEQLSGV